MGRVFRVLPPLNILRTIIRCSTSLKAHLSPLSDSFNTCHLHRPHSANKRGLFGIEELIHPSGFISMVMEAKHTCGDLLEEAKSPTRQRKIVQILDDMSDTLCRVADLADCIRILHPDDKFRQAATDACQSIGQLVEELNTNSQLFESSVRAASPNHQLAVDSRGDSIDKRVLDLFIADFEMSGVQLSDPIRQAEFVEAASKSMFLGAEFVETAHQPAKLDLDLLPHAFTPSIQPTSPAGRRLVDLTHPHSESSQSELRRLAYTSYYSPLDGQEQRLAQLLDARHKAARAAGFASFRHRSIRHSLAETPDNVDTFLAHLYIQLLPLASNVASRFALSVTNPPSTSSLKTTSYQRILPCHLPFTLGLRRHFLCQQDLSDYFSLGTCMEGISQLAECLFNVHLKAVTGDCDGDLDDVWHPSIVKVGVYSSSTKQLIGLVYCDLLDRPGKPQQDCHYTIQGGRSLATNSSTGPTHLTDRYQLPIVTLQLNLSPPPSSSSSNQSPPVLLSPGQVENLFHEWGHALHSILARTRYQHVTGTRCSTDLAELPSTLFEHFALDPRVTRVYARHWLTRERPQDSHRLSRAFESLAIGRLFGSSIELLQQATFAQFDQRLHSGPYNQVVFGENPSHSLPPSTLLLARIQQEAGLDRLVDCSPYQLGAGWPHRFSHLVTYPARYYAYLMARSGASMVWQRLFASDPWSSSNGQLYSSRLLQHGGEYHPASLLSSLLSVDASAESLTPDQLAHALTEQLHDSEERASSELERRLSRN